MASNDDGELPFEAESPVTPSKSRTVRSYSKFLSRGTCDVPGIPGLQAMGTFGSPPVVDPPVVVVPAVVVASDPDVVPEGAVVDVASEPEPLLGPVPDPPAPGPLVPGSMFFVSPTEPVHPADIKAARSKPVDPLSVAMSFIVSPVSPRPCDT